jgi:hypothetical protein
MENGDETLTCGGVDIEGNRCATTDDTSRKQTTNTPKFSGKYNSGKDYNTPIGTINGGNLEGRFPAQTYIDSGTSEIIDLQSGVSKSQVGKRNPNGKYHGVNSEVYGEFKPEPEKLSGFSDSGGASRILHKCDFEAGDYDLYNYCPKVSKSERSEGLDNKVIIYYDFDICQNEQNLTQEVLSLQLSEDMDKLHQKDTEEFGQQKKKDLLWNIDTFGKKLMEKFLMDCISTTKTTTSSTIDLTTWNWLTPLFTNESIQGVSLETMDGINLALSVDSFYTNQIITEIQKQGGFNHSVNLVELSKPLSIKGRLRLEPMLNNHCTLKPKTLLSKILKLFKTPNDQILLDPFMGSGSMGISAVETGFDYIGFELDQDYFQIAKTRIQTAENKIKEMLM